MSEKNREATDCEGKKGPDPKKDWTVLAYLGGVNNLSDELVFSIKAMKNVGPPLPEQGTSRVKFKVIIPLQ